jgi:hypothetical protein
VEGEGVLEGEKEVLGIKVNTIAPFPPGNRVSYAPTFPTPTSGI